MEHVLSKTGETSQSRTPNEATGTHNRPQSASFQGSPEAQSCMKGRDESMKYKAVFHGHPRNTSRPFRQSHYACVENEGVKLHVQRIEGLLEGTSICMQGNKRLWHWYKKFRKNHGE